MDASEVVQFPFVQKDMIFFLLFICFIYIFFSYAYTSSSSFFAFFSNITLTSYYRLFALVVCHYLLGTCLLLLLLAFIHMLTAICLLLRCCPHEY